MTVGLANLMRCSMADEEECGTLEAGRERCPIMEDLVRTWKRTWILFYREREPMEGFKQRNFRTF